MEVLFIIFCTMAVVCFIELCGHERSCEDCINCEIFARILLVMIFTLGLFTISCLRDIEKLEQSVEVKL